MSPVTAMVTLPPIDDRQKLVSQDMSVETIRVRQVDCNTKHLESCEGTPYEHWNYLKNARLEVIEQVL